MTDPKSVECPVCCARSGEPCRQPIGPLDELPPYWSRDHGCHADRVDAAHRATIATWLRAQVGSEWTSAGICDWLLAYEKDHGPQRVGPLLDFSMAALMKLADTIEKGELT